MGASNNPQRYSCKAISKLNKYGFDFIPLGIRKGEVEGKVIQNIAERPELTNVDTVTLYMNQVHQKEFYEYIIGLQPRRIIFNPGTENPELKMLASQSGIETIEDCTIVMLELGNY